MPLATKLTLTNTWGTNAGLAVQWINTSRSLTTLLSWQACSTAVHVGLTPILDTIIARGNYDVLSQISHTTGFYTHLDKDLIYKHCYCSLVHYCISIRRHIFSWAGSCHRSPHQSRFHSWYSHYKWELRQKRLHSSRFKFLLLLWQILSLQTPLIQSLISRQPIRSAHFCCGAHHPPQSTPVSFAFMTVSVHVGTIREKLTFLTFEVIILTLTGTWFTDTAGTVWSIIASQSIGTFFRGQAAATAVHISLISIPDLVIASGRYNRRSQIFQLSVSYHYLDRNWPCRPH